ncbi:MAG: EF-P lysine aminoacylase EpmA [Desulfobacterales bacterium]|jgi:lysyl-tRNA synthetase class 2|nr:EF-P lysine aminoacylase EpmA [Desulfobacterales bacterium]
MSIERHRKIQKNFILRAKILQAIRDFFKSNDFLEVETPIRIPALAPEPFISALSAETWYLQTSPELCMKRMLCAGYSKIFQICKCFRRRERGNRHLPEFTMLEWYEAESTYVDLMTQCEKLFRFICLEMNLPDILNYQGLQINLDPPWPKMSVKEAFERYSDVDMKTAISKDKFDEIISLVIEPHLGITGPVFLYDYPIERSALSAAKPGDSDLAQRFELYIAGLEICNGFTELTDADEQRKRFEDELAARKQQGEAAYPIPEKFLADLKFMPPAAGNALGIDRLVMLFADAASIDDVVAFIPEDL